MKLISETTNLITSYDFQEGEGGGGNAYEISFSSIRTTAITLAVAELY